MLSRSSVGETLIKIEKSDVDGKSCQNMKLKGGEQKFWSGEL